MKIGDQPDWERGPCEDCGRILITRWRWDHYGWRPEGSARMGVGKLCCRDLRRRKRRAAGIPKVVESSPVRTVGHCVAEGCGRPLVSNYSWRNRRDEVPATHSPHMGRGLCKIHYERLVVNADGPGRGRSRAEVLEEYLMIRSSVSSIAQAAERMGMSRSALEGALYRARKDGIADARPPLEQREAAAKYGHTYPIGDAS